MRPKPSEPLSIGELRLPDAAPIPRAVVDAAGGPRRRLHRARGPPPPRRRQELPGPDPAAHRRAAGRARRRARAAGRRRGRRDPARPARRSASRSSRSAAAPASSAASSRCAASSSGWSRSIWRALRDVEVDPISRTARLGPGLRGPEAEAALQARGYTLGHFPQSFRYATIGGFAATRSAGQASSGYGRFDQLVTELELTTPGGVDADARDARTRPPGRRCASWRRLRGDPRRDHRRRRPGPAGAGDRAATRAGSLPASPRGSRSSARSPRTAPLPDVVRLSDRDETEISLAMAGLEGLQPHRLRALPEAASPRARAAW